MSDLRSNLVTAGKLAEAPSVAPTPSVNAIAGENSILQSIVSNTNDLNTLKAELEKVRVELSAVKAKLVDLDKCIVQLDSALVTAQSDSAAQVAAKLQASADANVLLADRLAKQEAVALASNASLTERVAKVESLHSKLSSVFG